MPIKKPVALQGHHLLYKDSGAGGKTKRHGNRYDVVVPVRKGVHQYLTLMSRFNGLSLDELLATITQALIQYLAGRGK